MDILCFENVQHKRKMSHCFRWHIKLKKVQYALLFEMLVRQLFCLQKKKSANGSLWRKNLIQRKQGPFPWTCRDIQ